MEDLYGYTVLRKQLMAGIFDLKIAESIARHLAAVHRETHVSKSGREHFTQLCEEFQYVFSFSSVCIQFQYVPVLYMFSCSCVFQCSGDSTVTPSCITLLFTGILAFIGL